MNQDEYGWMVQDLAKSPLKTLEDLTPEKAYALHMAIGVCGEAGELGDAIKRWAIYGKEIDLVNVVEELGDLEFFMEAIRRVFLLTRAQCLTANYTKLMKKRYPNGYSNEAAQDRADKEAGVIMGKLHCPDDIPTPAQVSQAMADIKAMKDTSAKSIGETDFSVPKDAMAELFQPTNPNLVILNGQLFAKVDNKQ